MSDKEVIDRYFAAWNEGRLDAFADIFGPGGSYLDPMTGGPIGAPHLAGYASGLKQAFPDLRFEAGSLIGGPGGLYAVQWRMLGTNHGSLGGRPPTGKPIDIPGADFFHVVDGRLATVVGHFDSAAVPRQLGLMPAA